MRTVLPITEQRRQREQRRDHRHRALAETEDVGQPAPPRRVVLHEIGARVGADIRDEWRIVAVRQRTRSDDQHIRQRIVLEDIQRIAETGQLAELREALLRRAHDDPGDVLALGSSAAKSAAALLRARASGTP